MDREKLTVHRPNRADLVVREDQRGKGWGRLIYRILSHLAETEGAVCILAACRNDNTDGQAFYRAIECDATPLRDGETSWCIETSAARRL
jgi:GNAT superfamily N-acetyltransferase